jgi:hypothetical protein
LGNPLAGIDPLPTIFRQVSGKESITRMRQLPDKIVTNQKIHLQPKWALIAALSIGPKLGAVFVLPMKQLANCTRAGDTQCCDLDAQTKGRQTRTPRYLQKSLVQPGC